MKVNNLRLRAAFLSIVAAGGITLGSLNNVVAETKYQKGTFINETVDFEDTRYIQYVVQSGDNLSKISQKICHYYGVSASTEFWPALAFLNDYPKTIKPGDIILFPDSFEKLVILNDDLKAVGWTSRYIQNNGVYQNNNAANSNDIYSLLNDIYGDEVIVDDEFVHRYLKTQKLDKRYTVDDLQSIDGNTLFILTEWIPTIDELGYSKRNGK